MITCHVKGRLNDDSYAISNYLQNKLSSWNKNPFTRFIWSAATA